MAKKIYSTDEEWIEALKDLKKRRYSEDLKRRPYYFLTDTSKCEWCGITELEHYKTKGMRLSVHHINGDHEHNYKENLCCVCGACHLKIHRIQENTGIMLWETEEFGRMWVKNK